MSTRRTTTADGALDTPADLAPDPASDNRDAASPAPGDAVTGADPALVASRQCSRCRESFPVDDTLLFTAEYAWWLCPTCSSALLGKPTR